MLAVKDINITYTSFALDLTNNCSWWINDLAFRTYCAAFCLNLFYRTSSSSSILRRNKQFSSVATVQTDNGSIIIYFPAVLFLKHCHQYHLLPFCVTVKPKSRLFLSLYLTNQSCLLAKCIRNYNHCLTNVETTGAI
jgi:hypothetical protein